MKAAAHSAVTDEERENLAELHRKLGTGRAETVQVVIDGEHFTLPAEVLMAFRALVRGFASARTVRVVSPERKLRTQEAADILNVSRPYLTKLLDRGDIPFTLVGNQRRVRFDDLLAYKAKRDAGRRAAIDDLIAASQEYGLYDEP
jgi:excisionase family DNA binding protein